MGRDDLNGLVLYHRTGPDTVLALLSYEPAENTITHCEYAGHRYAIERLHGGAYLLYGEPDRGLSQSQQPTTNHQYLDSA